MVLRAGTTLRCLLFAFFKMGRQRAVTGPNRRLDFQLAFLAAKPMPTDSQHDYYALLGVRPEIGFAELRRVWRRLARHWHPDHAGHAATATFQNISAAYEVLSDPVARAAYDRRRGIPPGRSPNSPSATAPRRKAPGVALRRLCGPLNSLVACGVARRIGNDVI